MEGTTLRARMGRVENKLENVENRLDQMDKRFDNIDVRFDTVDKKFDAIDKKFDAIDVKFNAIDKKFDNIDGQLEKMGVMLVNHDHDIKEIKTRLDSMDQTLKMFGKFQETLDVLVGYFKDNRQEVIMMEPRFKRLELRVAVLETNLQPV